MNDWVRTIFAIVTLAVSFGAGWTFAQQQTQAPTIISGADVGFRVDQQRTQLGHLAGSWVVRFNGQWVEPDTSGPRALTTR